MDGGGSHGVQGDGLHHIFFLVALPHQLLQIQHSLLQLRAHLHHTPDSMRGASIARYERG